MKQIITVILVIVAIASIGVSCQSARRLQAELDIYKEYYTNTEEFLDTLEEYDNWVDRFDPQGYYSSIEKINKLQQE